MELGATCTEELNSIVETYYPAIFAYARRKLGNPHDAEDAAQETFAKIQQGLSGFSGRGQIKTWLYTVGRNAVYDCLRRRRRSARVTPWTEEIDCMAALKDPPARDPDRLTSLVSRLSEEDRRLIVRVFQEKLSIPQIAATTSEPVYRVRRRLQNILAELRAITDADLL
jgi:RNA polymerase sigma factor (sigma-70 family)